MIRLNRFNIVSLILLGSIALTSCTDDSSNTHSNRQSVLSDTLISFSVEADSSWTNRFYRKRGWFGADGIFSFTPNGVESVVYLHSCGNPGMPELQLNL